jgi:transposase
MKLQVRAMTAEETATLERWSRARSGPVRLRDRALVLQWSHLGWWVSDIARFVGVSTRTVRLWITRFNAQGLAGLQDAPRSGRPPTYTPEQVGAVIAAALTNPQELGLPFGAWTLDRLAAYLNEERGIAIKRSRIDELLIDEGLRWRTQETWFGERAGREPAPAAAEQTAARPVDPDFARKRGRSRRSTPRRRRVA